MEPSPMFREPLPLGHHPSTCGLSVLQVLSSHCFSRSLTQAEVQITKWQIPCLIMGWKWEPVPPFQGVDIQGGQRQLLLCS